MAFAPKPVAARLNSGFGRRVFQMKNMAKMSVNGSDNNSRSSHRNRRAVSNRLNNAVFEALEKRQLMSSVSFLPDFSTYFKVGTGNEGTTNDQSGNSFVNSGGPGYQIPVVESKSASSYRDDYLQFNLSSPAFAGQTISSVTLTVNAAEDNTGNSGPVSIAVYNVTNAPNRLLTSSDAEGTIAGNSGNDNAGSSPIYGGASLISTSQSVGVSGSGPSTAWTSYTYTLTSGITASTNGFVTLSLATPSGSTGAGNVTAFEDTGSADATTPTLTVNYTAAALPSAPTGLSAAAGPNETQLTWTAGSGASSYNIFRGTTSGGEVKIATGVSGTSFIDNGTNELSGVQAPHNGTTYFYEVQSSNTFGTSTTNSNEASVTPSNVLAAAPSGVTVTPVSAGGTTVDANVSWGAVTSFPAATSYNVLRAPDNSGSPGTFVQIASGIAGNTFTDTGPLTAGNTYWYEVQSVDGTNNTGSAATSSPVSAQIYLPVTIGDYSFETPVGGGAYNPNLSPYWTVGAGGGFSQMASTVSNNYPWAVSDGNQAIYIASDNTLGDNYVRSGSLGTIQTGTYTLSAYVGTGNSQGGDTKFDLRIYDGTTIVADSGLQSFGGLTGRYYTQASYQASLTFDNTVYNSGNLSVWIGGVSQNLTVDNVQLSLLPGALQAPAAPTGLTAVPASQQVNLNWNASSGATSYNIYEGTSSGGETLLTSTTSTSASVTGLTNGTTYYYYVTAVDSAGQSGQSNEVSATPQSAAPQSPANLTAVILNNTTPGSTASGVPSAVQLNWTEAAAPPATSYTVLRQNASGGSFVFVANVSGGSNTAFTDTTVAANISYNYEVEANNASGTSSPSSQANVTTVNYVGITNPSFEQPANVGQYNPTFPGWTVSQPNNLPALGASTSTNQLPWAVTDGIQALVLQPDNSNPTPPSATTASLGTVQPGTYSLNVDVTTNTLYRSPSYDLQLLVNGVVAADTGAQSIGSAEQTVNLTFDNTTYDTGALTLKLIAEDGPGQQYGAYVGFDNVNMTFASGSLSTPSSPTNLTATPADGEALLSWTGSAGANSYNVSVGTSSGHEAYLTNVSGTTTSIDVTGLTDGTTYYFTVTAVNSAGSSSPSNEASATPMASVASPPTNVNAAQSVATGGVSPISVSWTAPTHPSATGYTVLRSDNGGSFNFLANVSGGSNTIYNDSAVVEGHTYSYEVESVDAAGIGSASSASNTVTEYANVPVPDYSFENPSFAQNGEYNPVFRDSSGNVAWAYKGGGPVQLATAGDGFGYMVSDGSQAAVIPNGSNSYLTSEPLALASSGTYTLSVFVSTSNAGANDSSFEVEILNNGEVAADSGQLTFSNVTGTYYNHATYEETLQYTPSTAQLGGTLTVKLLGEGSQLDGFDNVQLTTTGSYTAIPTTPSWLNVSTGATVSWSNETLNVTSGTVTITADPAASSDLPLINLASGTNLIVNTGSTTGGDVHIAGLNLSSGSTFSIAAQATPTATNHVALVLGTLNGAPPTILLSPTSKLDLNDNDLIVHNASYGTISSLVATGYNNGQWNGAGGIVSTTASNSSSHLYALGEARPGGSNTFDGENVNSSDVEVVFTYYGDATLGGAVNSASYARIDNGFLGKLSGWQNGDFNYDGVINGSDYTLIDNAFNQQGTAVAATQIAVPAAVATSPFATTGSSSILHSTGLSVEQLLVSQDVLDALSAS